MSDPSKKPATPAEATAAEPEQAADVGAGSPLVTPPGSALDPMVALATSVHASPGIYALLLGSGVSTGAAIPTGWQVVCDLVRRAAAAEGADPDAVAADPEGWWAAQGRGELGYSSLLAALGPTAAARRQLLAGYFEPDPEDPDNRRPSPAHHAVAELVRRGHVRVVLTTNFDRLTERALEAAGVSPQVISRAEAVAGMTPLAHASATVVKLHGDYQDLDQRNTIDELDAYDATMQRLLDRVLDEYGLMVCGWSAEWDRALVRALEAVQTRRYPLFWSAYGPLAEPARRLVAQHRAVVIAGRTADEFFPDLVARLDALAALATPPLSRALAVAHLKRALPDPTRRIELFDLVDGETTRVLERINDRDRYPLHTPELSGTVLLEALDARLAAYRGDVDTLLHLVATGVFHGPGEHDDVWVRALTRLLEEPAHAQGTYQETWDKAQLYPVMLTLWSAGVAAVAGHREDLLARLLLEPTRKGPGESDARPAVKVLSGYRVLDPDKVNALPRWPGNQRWILPVSELLHREVRDPVQPVLPSQARYGAAFERFEYLRSLVEIDANKGRWSSLGRFAYALRYLDQLPIEQQVPGELGPEWPLLRGGAFGGDPDRAAGAKAQLATFCREVRSW
jgi:hypothetical protein